jgi:hypothetical protein
MWTATVTYHIRAQSINQSILQNHKHTGRMVKVKGVNMSLCLTKHHTEKAFGGVEVYLHVFLASALYGFGQLHDLATLEPIQPKEPPSSHWIGD